MRALSNYSITPFMSTLLVLNMWFPEENVEYLTRLRSLVTLQNIRHQKLGNGRGSKARNTGP